MACVWRDLLCGGCQLAPYTHVASIAGDCACVCVAWLCFLQVEQRQFKDYPSPLLLGVTCEGALLIHPGDRVG